MQKCAPTCAWCVFVSFLEKQWMETGLQNKLWSSKLLAEPTDELLLQRELSQPPGASSGRSCNVTGLLVDSFHRTKSLHGNTWFFFFFLPFFPRKLSERRLCLKMTKMILYSTRACCCSSRGAQCAYCVVTLLLFLRMKSHVHSHSSSVNSTVSSC